MLSKTLIVGCGRKQVTKIKEDCICADISLEYLKESKKLRLNNFYCVADGKNIPFKENCFDKVICTEVLEHVDSPKKVLKEIDRILIANGKLVISVPKGDTEMFLGKHFKVYERDVNNGFHKTLFTRDMLIKLLNNFNKIYLEEDDKLSTMFWLLWGKTEWLFNDLKINDSGKILSLSKPRLVRWMSRFILGLAIILKVFLSKKYYKTFYVEARK